MKGKILVTYANRYSIPATQDSDMISGTTINYFFMDDEFSNFNTKFCTDTDLKGVNRAKGNLDYNVFSALSRVPAIYEADIDYKISADGKPTLRVLGLEYFADVKMEVILPSKK